MGGVFGAFDGRGTTGRPVKAIVAEMGRMMSHRPWHRVDLESDADATIGLGRISLGVINPAVQPASDPDRRLSLFLAGEFYYRDTLLQTLETGRRPAPDADDAWIALQLYLAHGPQFVESVEGMFSIAIWDRRTAHLFLLNDRFGLVPTYYAHGDRQLYFAPEMKAVLHARGTPLQLDETALAEYVRYQQLLGEKTLFAGVSLLPPATMLSFDLRTSALERRTYWDGSRLEPLAADVGQRDIEDETCRLLRRAVQTRLERARRPGVMLSGGLDSRTLLAVAVRQGARPAAVTFGHPDSRDMRLASRVASAAGVRHHIHPLGDGGWVTQWVDLHLDLAEGAHSWMHAHGISALPLARDVMDVNLSGVAGVFGELFNKPGTIYAEDQEALVHNLHRFYSQEHAWPGLSAEEEHALYTPAWSRRLAGRAFESLCTELQPYRRLHPQLQGLVFNLHNHSRRMNHYLVIFSNAFIENRCPYFDYDLTDWLLRVPVPAKSGKQLHVAALSRAAPKLTRIPYDKDYRLPIRNPALRGLHAVFDRSAAALRQAAGVRAGLRTLSVDYENYLRQELRGWAEGILLSDRMLSRGIFRRDAVQSLLRRHVADREPWIVGKFNALITLEMMMRRFCNG